MYVAFMYTIHINCGGCYGGEAKHEFLSFTCAYGNTYGMLECECVICMRVSVLSVCVLCACVYGYASLACMQYLEMLNADMLLVHTSCAAVWLHEAYTHM